MATQYKILETKIYEFSGQFRFSGKGSRTVLVNLPRGSASMSVIGRNVDIAINYPATSGPGTQSHNYLSPTDLDSVVGDWSLQMEVEIVAAYEELTTQIVRDLNFYIRPKVGGSYTISITDPLSSTTLSYSRTIPADWGIWAWTDNKVRTDTHMLQGGFDHDADGTAGTSVVIDGEVCGSGSSTTYVNSCNVRWFHYDGVSNTSLGYGSTPYQLQVTVNPTDGILATTYFITRGNPPAGHTEGYPDAFLSGIDAHFALRVMADFQPAWGNSAKIKIYSGREAYENVPVRWYGNPAQPLDYTDSNGEVSFSYAHKMAYAWDNTFPGDPYWWPYNDPSIYIGGFNYSLTTLYFPTLGEDFQPVSCGAYIDPVWLKENDFQVTTPNIWFPCDTAFQPSETIYSESEDPLIHRTENFVPVLGWSWPGLTVAQDASRLLDAMNSDADWTATDGSVSLVSGNLVLALTDPNGYLEKSYSSPVTAEDFGKLVVRVRASEDNAQFTLQFGYKQYRGTINALAGVFALVELDLCYPTAKASGSGWAANSVVDTTDTRYDPPVDETLVGGNRYSATDGDLWGISRINTMRVLDLALGVNYEFDYLELQASTTAAQQIDVVAANLFEGHSCPGGLRIIDVSLDLGHTVGTDKSAYQVRRLMTGRMDGRQSLEVPYQYYLSASYNSGAGAGFANGNVYKWLSIEDVVNQINADYPSIHATLDAPTGTDIFNDKSLPAYFLYGGGRRYSDGDGFDTGFDLPLGGSGSNVEVQNVFTSVGFFPGFDHDFGYGSAFASPSGLGGGHFLPIACAVILRGGEWGTVKDFDGNPATSYSVQVFEQGSVDAGTIPIGAGAGREAEYYTELPHARDEKTITVVAKVLGGLSVPTPTDYRKQSSRAYHRVAFRVGKTNPGTGLTWAQSSNDVKMRVYVNDDGSFSGAWAGEGGGDGAGTLIMGLATDHDGYNWDDVSLGFVGSNPFLDFDWSMFNRAWLMYVRGGNIYKRYSDNLGKDWSAEEEFATGDHPKTLKTYQDNRLFAWYDEGENTINYKLVTTANNELISGVAISGLAHTVTGMAVHEYFHPGENGKRKWDITFADSEGGKVITTEDDGQTWTAPALVAPGANNIVSHVSPDGRKQFGYTVEAGGGSGTEFRTIETDWDNVPIREEKIELTGLDIVSVALGSFDGDVGRWLRGLLHRKDGNIRWVLSANGGDFS